MDDCLPVTYRLQCGCVLHLKWGVHHARSGPDEPMFQRCCLVLQALQSGINAIPEGDVIT